MPDPLLPDDLDLKMLPLWAQEQTPGNPYASYKGEADTRERGGFRGDARPPRDRDRNRDRRDQGQPRGPRREGQSDRRGKGGEAGRDRDRGPQRQQNHPPEDRPKVAPAPVQVTFLPEKIFLTSVANQVKSTSRAYPIFALAKMFLEKPERHRVVITSQDKGLVLFQAGENGPVTTNRAQAERAAFDAQRANYYAEQEIQTEEIKGNYTNVARCRVSGTLLGPTNHHSYQRALRGLYDQRFSRRMDFQEFLRQVEVVSDPALVAQWKEEARSQRTWNTTQEPEPVVLHSLQDTHEHFRRHYLEKVIRQGSSFDMPGPMSRQLEDRSLVLAIRQAWDRESRFPGQVAHELRRGFQDMGLHVFKHRHRMLFVATTWPRRFGGHQQSVSEHVQQILQFVEAHPNCTRNELAGALIPAGLDEESATKAKSTLATDLHFLVKGGHVIDFYDGRLDLPLPPKPPEEKPSQKIPAKGSSAQHPAAPATGTGKLVTSQEPATAPSIPVANESAAEPEPVVDAAQPEVVIDPPVAMSVPAAEPAPEAPGNA